MSNYVIAYYGGKEARSPEEASAGMAKFRAWLAALGDAVVNPGTPLGKCRSLSSGGVTDGCGATSLTGFSIVKAESLEAACELAGSCPFLDIGTIEVAEVLEM
jgi:hypothetical protein